MDPAIIWFLIGLGLIIAELAVPGIILVFFGIAAWVVAILDWCGVESLSVQLWIFGITSLLLVFVLRRFVKDWFLGSQLTAELRAKLTEQIDHPDIHQLLEANLSVIDDLA